MKRLILALLLSAATAPAFAADVLVPVDEIMAQAVQSWSENPGEPRDYFDEDRLARIFSKDFADTYRAAAKFPAYDDGASPFDYDVIIDGQDGCSLKDLQVEAGAVTDGVTDVVATFDNTHCFGERAVDWKPTEVHFKVIEENGHAVIDDILMAGEGNSVKAEARQIANQDPQ